MSRSVVGFEHSVKDSLQVADLVGVMDGGQLSDRIAVRIDDGIGP